jgi:hypothetical protein
MINISSIKKKGMSLRPTKESSEGRLRGGSVGVEFEDGMNAGECMRKAYSRFLGKESDIKPYTRLMFDAGERNEDSWMQDLELGWEGSVIKADNYVEWATKNGVSVTGSPDVLLLDTDGRPVKGIEHKHLSSVTTAFNALTQGPNLKHVIQAAHYSSRVGVDFDIVYTNSINLHGPNWLTSKDELPKPGQKGSEFIQYTYYNKVKDGVYSRGKNKGKPRFKRSKVLVNANDQDLDYLTLTRLYPDINDADFKNFRPFFLVYNLKIEKDGSVLFKREDEDNWTSTIVSVGRINAFYERLSTLKESNNLPPRPLNLSVTGDKEFWNPCDYCELKPNCDRFEGSKKDWEDSL